MQITSHKTNHVNSKIHIKAAGEPVNGAYHRYEIDIEGLVLDASIEFQNGSFEDVGVNGITHECLLAIIEHRLSCFQEGDLRCRENAIALTKIQEARMWLQKRTTDRQTRGAEGSHNA